MVILGISIGTRSSGIAILENGELAAWNTICFRNEWSEKKALKIIKCYEDYLKSQKVTAVVLKIPPLTHQTSAILDLLNKLQELIACHGCMVEYTTKAEIKGAIPGLRNTKQLISHAAELYPVLSPECCQELANRNSYHTRMFEAVIVAHLYNSKLK